MFKFYYLFFSIFIVFSCSKELLSQDNEDVVLALKVHNDSRKEVGVNLIEWSRN